MKEIKYKKLRIVNLQEIKDLLKEEYGPDFGPLFSGWLFVDGVFQPFGNVGIGAFDENDKLVSMAWLSYYRRLPCDDCPTGFVAELNGVYTKEEYRRKGIATEIVHRLIDIAKAKNIDYVHADTKKEINDLYYKIGFIHQSETEDRLWYKLK